MREVITLIKDFWGINVENKSSTYRLILNIFVPSINSISNLRHRTATQVGRARRVACRRRPTHIYKLVSDKTVE